MDYLDKPDPQTFIAHHGIKGQKWGVRRFQNEDGSLTKAGKERYNEQNSSNSSDNSENQKFHLTEKQKKYCKTIAIATGVALVTYAGFKLADSGELNRLVEKAKEVSLGSHYQGFSKNEDYSGPLSVESIKDGLLNKINPNFSSTFSLGSVGSYNNCKRCTFAYELSRRGYDVRATQTIAGTGQNLNGNNMMLFVPRCSRKDYKQALKTWKNDPSIYATNNLIKKLSGGLSENIRLVGDTQNKFKSIYDSIEKMPDRARGELSITWSNRPGGHSLAWEVIDHKPIVFDCQTRRVYDTPVKFSKILNQALANGIDSATLCRLDDKDLNLDLLRRWVKNS